MTNLRSVIVDAVERLRTLIQGDGADLRLLAVDDSAGTIELALELESAGCADCVLSPQQLHEILATSLATQVRSHRIVLRDPRTGIVTPAERRYIRVLDPPAEFAAADRDPGPDAGALAGKTVAFRVDVLWQSWDRVVDEWTATLNALGVEVRRSAEFRDWLAPTVSTQTASTTSCSPRSRRRSSSSAITARVRRGRSKMRSVLPRQVYRRSRS